VNNYYVTLTDEQEKIHQGYAQLLGPLLHKKFLTPMDVKRIQELLLLMRMVSDSTYLIDRKTNFSPKLAELDSILDELIIQNNRKVVIFSEWTTMTYLIATKLSGANIAFVELSGKIPVKKRQALIDEFTNNPQCKVFLSTDAGGTGLNLQAADCVINFEPPWNPSKLNQRIGRVNRIGQTSKCINVINLIASNSIEARILAGLQLKTDLFQGVFDGTTDTVEFSREKRAELLKQLEGMLDQKPEPKEPTETVEIAEDDPFFLNPKVLNDAKDTIEYQFEEATGETSAIETTSANKNEAIESSRTGESLFAKQPPERVEAVLNKGMEFISGLLEMATGQSLQKSGNSEKLIQIDQQTGEVVMKFKLPGF
jgi:superfamily II DNA/RNA helicase